MTSEGAGNSGGTRAAPAPALHMMRLCGEFGPVLFCCGELTVATEEALRRELAFLEPLGFPVLTLDLSGCDFLDTEAAFTLLDCSVRWAEQGRGLVVVAGTGQPANLLRVMGTASAANRQGRAILVFESSEQAARVLRERDAVGPGRRG